MKEENYKTETVARQICVLFDDLPRAIQEGRAPPETVSSELFCRFDDSRPDVSYWHLAVITADKQKSVNFVQAEKDGWHSLGTVASGAATNVEMFASRLDSQFQNSVYEYEGFFSSVQMDNTYCVPCVMYAPVELDLIKNHFKAEWQPGNIEEAWEQVWYRLSDYGPVLVAQILVLPSKRQCESTAKLFA